MAARIAQLVLLLSSPDAGQRARAAEELAQAGPEARAAALPLLKACGDEDEDVREWAVESLENLGPPQVEDLDELAGRLASPTADIAYWAATLIGRLGAEAAPAVGALAAALSAHPAIEVKQRSAWALGQIGSAAAGARAALNDAAQSDDPRLARLAAKALQQIDTPP